jgi:ribulose-5-phosphate 4-epimerase/fuculose-1-phosphate aldolase
LLNYIWAFGKNQYPPEKNSAAEFISYEDLIESVISIYKEMGRTSIDRFVQNMITWLVETDDNILIALLRYEYDEVRTSI